MPKERFRLDRNLVTSPVQWILTVKRLRTPANSFALTSLQTETTDVVCTAPYVVVVCISYACMPGNFVIISIISLFLFFPLSGARNFFTASSDSLFHPPLSLVFFFQSSSYPAFLTSLDTVLPFQPWPPSSPPALL